MCATMRQLMSRPNLFGLKAHFGQFAGQQAFISGVIIAIF